MRCSKNGTQVRLGKIAFYNKGRPSTSNITKHRNEFDKDYDRIVYSSSIRRLQDKAQVFPLQENDFTRTRLTHSIEASALAKSLGAAIGHWLRNEKGVFTDKQERELSSLLQVAALIHDLGNPPFGHYGEDVIKKWFVKWFNSENFEHMNKEIKEDLALKDEEKEDFKKFEGNAQTLRIVTKLQMLNDQFGVNFTYATLATIIKYPWLSNNDTDFKADKFGYFNSEKDIVDRIRISTGLQVGMRHPATFLLEAADDIAYLCADIEDAVKKGIIHWDEEYNKVKNALSQKSKDYENMFKELDEQNSKNKAKEIPEAELVSIQNFKVKSQGLMFKGVVEGFKENYDSIMNGEYEFKSLLENPNLKDLIKELEKLQRHCFVDKEVLTLELVGDTVINGLLDMFVKELVNCTEEPKSKIKSGKYIDLYQKILNMSVDLIM